jgi:hypothetical protein
MHRAFVPNLGLAAMRGLFVSAIEAKKAARTANVEEAEEAEEAATRDEPDH